MRSWKHILVGMALGVFGSVPAHAQWTITSPYCSISSPYIGNSVVSCGGFSRTEFTQTITFAALASCQNARMCIGGQPIVASETLVIGISQPCPGSVSYTFWGGVDPGGTANIPYVYVNMQAQATGYPRVDASDSVDCLGDNLPIGPSGGPLPC